MRQFILDRMPGSNGRVILEGSDYRYLAQVLRKTPGASVEARLPDGSLCLFTVETLDAKAKTVRLLRAGSHVNSCGDSSGETGSRCAQEVAIGDSMPPLSLVPEGFPRIILFQWMLKGPKMDQVIRQATETGVSVIVPVSGERCLPRDQEGSARTERWNRIVRESRQQSGSPVPTVVHQPIAVSAVGDLWRALGGEAGVGRSGEDSHSVALVLTEAPLARKTLHEYLDTGIELAALATGPEGGMTAAELDALGSAGFFCVHFRTNILRAETAALYGIAAVQTAIMETEKWQLKE